MAEVIVIGAGLAGLVVTHRLATAGVDVVALERAEVAGGHVRTVQRDGWRHERGPNSFLGSATPLFTLAEELGLEPVQARPQANRRYLYLDGALERLPESPKEALASSLLPPRAKLRLLGEPLTFSKARDEESVREFFESRFGPQVVERLVDPFVSGVYGGDVAQLGISSAFPKLYAMAKEHGSILRAAMALGRRRPPGRKGTWSFPGGLGDLTNALVGRIGERLRVNEHVLVRRRGEQWVVGGRTAKALVIAAPAWATARLVHGELPALAAELAALDYAPMVGVHLKYRHSDIPSPFDGIGLLIPRSEGPRTLGVLWPSVIFDVCAPGDATITSFIGGAHDRGAVGLGDEELARVATRDLRRTMGIASAPSDVSVVRHERAIPQYSTRHGPWRTRVGRIVDATPGLHLTGNWLEGVSMGDTVAHAERTAHTVLRALGRPRT